MLKYEGESNRKTVEKQLKNYISLDHLPEIKGYDFDKAFNSKEFFSSFLQMGFQGSNLGKGINILKEIFEKKKKNNLKLFISFTGNMISSGNRELIKFLAKNKLIDGIITTAAAIEEDVMKCIKSFHLGNFDVKGEFLLDNQVGRIGNIFVPADRYLYFERFLNEVFKSAYELQKSENKFFAPNEFVNLLAKNIKKNEYTKENHKISFLYWAQKNNIPVFCPGITDGAIGDISTFFKNKHPDFVIDITGENKKITSLLMNAEETACIVLGGGIAKHFLLNGAIFRDGFEYSIYITTAHTYDGSDSGGNQEEAITWAKIKPTAKRVIINSDATIAFPVLLAGALNS